MRYTASSRTHSRASWTGSDNGLSHAALRDLDARLHGAQRVITFDDGDISNASRAAAAGGTRHDGGIFRHRRFRRPTGHACAGGTARVAAAGMGVQSHGMTHRYLADLAARELEHELRRSKRRSKRGRRSRSRRLRCRAGAAASANARAALRLGYRQCSIRCPAATRVAARGDICSAWRSRASCRCGEFARLVQWRGVAPARAARALSRARHTKRCSATGVTNSLRARVLAR